MYAGYLFTYPDPQNYDELEIWQHEAKIMLHRLCEGIDSLQNENDQFHLQELDLKEWRTTFAPYGCEPQACLHTLLRIPDTLKDEIRRKPATSTDELVKEAKAWDVRCSVSYPQEDARWRDKYLALLALLTSTVADQVKGAFK